MINYEIFLYFIRISYFKKDSATEQGSKCPADFPNFDSGVSKNNVGDICRNEKFHGFNVGWTCPAGCVGIANAAPYCKKSSSDNSPCRVTTGKLLYTCMKI